MVESSLLSRLIAAFSSGYSALDHPYLREGLAGCEAAIRRCESPTRRKWMRPAALTHASPRLGEPQR